MPAPTNISAATATELTGDFPIAVTQTADSAGTTYDLWFQRTVATGETEWSCFAFGDLVTYQPTTTFWTGPAAAPVLIQTGGVNKAIQVSVTPYVGDVLYLRVRPNAGNPSPALLTLNVQSIAVQAVAVGAVAVNDDRVGFPAVFYHPATGAPYTYLSGFPTSDFVDVLPSGRVLALNDTDDTWTLFAPNLSILAHPNPGTGFTRVTSNQSDTFYVGNSTTGVVKTISAAGVVGGTTWTLTAGFYAIAPSLDDTILYFVKATGANKAIGRWDLVNDVALTDLVAGIANYASQKTLLVLGNGSIVAGYNLSPSLAASQALNYSAAGATLHTYDYTTNELNKLSHAIDDPNSFWVWLFTNTTAHTFRFTNTKVSDGSVLNTFDRPDYTAGIYAGTATATPLRFGNSNSCQFWIQRAPMNVQTTTSTIRRQRRFLAPSSPDNKTMQMPVLELLMRTGIGLTPTDSWGGSLPLGVDPQVMIRVSRDGGKTWGPERWVSAGRLGKFADRVRLTRFSGSYRNLVIEVTCDAPVDFGFLAALAPNGITEGNS